MSTPPSDRRTYDSPRRRAQAAATRGAILDAARRLFLLRGFAATTIRAVADAADVSPETVYATFGTKPGLLAAVVDVAIAGDDMPAPLLDREWVGRLREEPDRVRRVGSLAHHGRLILERRSGIDEVVREAAATDPSIAELDAKGRAQRRSGQHALLSIVAGAEGFRVGLDPDAAADILFALGSPEVWRLLVVDRGWSAERFEAWYADVITGLLA